MALLLLAGAVTFLQRPSQPAEAQECEVDPETLDCSVSLPVPLPGGPSTPGQDEGGDGGDDSGGGPVEDQGPTNDQTAGVDAECAEYVVTGAAADPYRAQFPDAPPDQNFYVCQEPDGDVRVRLAPANAEPTPPDPADIAATLLAQVESQMQAPEIVADPPVGTAAVITLPVFVQVINWVGEIEEEDCVLGVCVTLTATPTLTFDPGEPGSSPIECDPPGTRFDPNGPDPEVQASAPGACAYAYQARTGADGRPDEWPGEVRVTWEVSWTAGDAAETLDPMTLSTELPRAVDEVQTVVRNGGG